MTRQQFTESKIEALILASPEPLAGRKIAQVLEGVTPSEVADAVTRLNETYAEIGSSFRIREIAGGYQYYIMPDYVGYVEELFSRRRNMRLSRASLETIAIVAYRQPVSKTDIEHIRGVASDGVIRNLLEKNLITITGRGDSVGRPLQYGTTDEFLKFFGLASLTDLPQMREIESMISAAEAKNQTELSFELDADGQPVKLNIADGMFNPNAREELAEASHEMSEREQEASESTALKLVRSGGEEVQGERLSEDDEAEDGEEESEEQPQSVAKEHI